jgi:hypothetical protein
MVCTCHQVDELAGMWLEWGRGNGHTGLWWGNLREGDHLEDKGLDERTILKWKFKK